MEVRREGCNAVSLTHRRPSYTGGLRGLFQVVRNIHVGGQGATSAVLAKKSALIRINRTLVFSVGSMIYQVVLETSMTNG